MTTPGDGAEFPLSRDHEDTHQVPEAVALRVGESMVAQTSQFPIWLEGRQDFEAAVYSETLGSFSDASVTINNDRPSGPQDVVYDFGEPGDRHISASVSVRPGLNDIVFSLGRSGIEQPEEARLKVIAPGRAYTSAGIEFLLSEQSQAVDEAALDQVAAWAGVMNGYLERPVSQIFIRDGLYPAGSAHGGKLGLSRFNFDSPNRDPNGIAWHELAHFYYSELAGENHHYLQEDQQKPYGERFSTLYEDSLRLSRVEGSTDRRWGSIRPNSIMEVFNSEMYIDTADPSHGHPQSHAGELFAYGSDILLFHADAFMQRVSLLATEEERRLALEVAGTIASAYVRDGVIPEVLQPLQRFQEQTPDPESPATSAQAQEVIDEIDRITERVRVSPGLEGVKFNTAPKKSRWHRDLFFYRYPEGEGNIDDPATILFGGAAWDNPDGSRTSYGVELALEEGLQLTKHIEAPSGRRRQIEAATLDWRNQPMDYIKMAVEAAPGLARDWETRKQERAYGLHLATSGEAAELLAKLQQMDPAPERAF